MGNHNTKPDMPGGEGSQNTAGLQHFALIKVSSLFIPTVAMLCASESPPLLLLCLYAYDDSVSGEAPQEPVVSPKSGMLQLHKLSAPLCLGLGGLTRFYRQRLREAPH